MTDAQNRKVTGKALALVVLIVIVTAVAAMLIQQLILGKSNTAVTGGVVGAITAAMAITTLRKKSS